MSRDMFLLPPGKLLEMITIDAARALGWDDEIGSLDVGKKADVAIVNLRQPHLTPNVMVVHRLVYEAVGNDVETVIVDGRVLMEDRTVLSVDEAKQTEAGAFTDLVLTEVRTSLGPALVQHWYYASGVGPVMVETVSGGSEQVELVSYSAGSG